MTSVNSILCEYIFISSIDFLLELLNMFVDSNLTLITDVDQDT